MGRFVFVSGTELVNEEADVKLVRDLTTVKEDVTDNNTALTELFFDIGSLVFIFANVVAN